MTERRVRPLGRQVYGRVRGLNRPKKSRDWRPSLSLLQRRLILLVVIIGVIGFVAVKLFAVTAIVVTTPGRMAEVTAEAEKALKGSWLQGNLLTFDNEAFVSDLQQADPLLRKIEVRRRWPHGLAVTVSLKQPSLGWSSGNQKYLLDVDGTVIGNLSAGIVVPVVQDGSNLPVQVGKRVVSTHFVAFVTSVVPALTGQGIGVTALDVKETTLDLMVSTNKGYRLIFDTGREVSEELTDLKAVLALLAGQKRTPAEYIDLRVAGKAYYK